MTYFKKITVDTKYVCPCCGEKVVAWVGDSSIGPVIYDLDCEGRSNGGLMGQLHDDPVIREVLQGFLEALEHALGYEWAREAWEATNAG